MSTTTMEAAHSRETLRLRLGRRRRVLNRVIATLCLCATALALLLLASILLTLFWRGLAGLRPGVLIR